MRVFLDTNVRLAGRFGHGLCAALLEALIESPCVLLADERVLEEFRRIARTKFHVGPDVLAEADVFFDEFVEKIPTAADPTPGVPDPDDAWILASAIAARAELFVTRDKALLDLGSLEGLAIVDPRAAYMRLRGLG